MQKNFTALPQWVVKTGKGCLRRRHPIENQQHYHQPQDRIDDFHWELHRGE